MKKLFALTLLFSFFGAAQLCAMRTSDDLRYFQGRSAQECLEDLRDLSPQKNTRTKKAVAKREARNLKGKRKLSLDNFGTRKGKKQARGLEIQYEREKSLAAIAAIQLGH